MCWMVAIPMIATAASGLIAALNTDLDDFLHNRDSGVLLRRGLNAEGSVRETADFIRKRREQLTSGMSRAARRMFEDRAQQLHLSTQRTVSRHEGTEGRQALFDSMKNAAAADLRLIENNPYDGRLFGEAKGRIRFSTLRMAQMDGMDAEGTKLFLQKAASETVLKRAGSFLAQGDFETAFPLLKDKALLSSDRLTLRKSLREETVRQGKALAEADPEWGLRYADNRLRMLRPLSRVAAFESGKEGSLAIGYDKNGGTSYGRFQIASGPGTMDAFLSWLEKNSQGEIAKVLREAGPANTGSARGAMPDAWKKLAAEGKITDEMQERFIEETHLAPVLRGLSPEAAAILSQDPALMAFVASTAIQHGATVATEMIRDALATSGGDRQAFVEALQEERKTRFPSSDPARQKAAAKRMDREKIAFSRQEADPQSTDDLLDMADLLGIRNAAEKKLRQEEARKKQEASVLLENEDDYFTYAQETGDYSLVDKMGQSLLDLGLEREALEVQTLSTIYQAAQPALDASNREPLVQRAASLEQTFGTMLRRMPEHAAAITKVREASLKALAARGKAFAADPAGYAASLGGEEPTDPPPPPAIAIRDSLSRQEYMAQGLAGFIPKILTKAQADDLNARYHYEEDATKQAGLIAELAKTYGKYASQAAAEAHLPAGIVAVGQIAGSLPPATLTRLTAAVNAKDGDLPQLTKEMTEDLDNNAFLRTMRDLSHLMYAANPQREFALGVGKAVRDFARAGGRPGEITDHFFVANDGNLLIAAPRGMVPQGLESALAFKTWDLLHAADSPRAPLPEGSPEEKAATRELRSFYANMVRNGKWVFDGLDGFVLIDQATGRAAIDLSGKAIALSAGEISAMRYGNTGLEYPVWP